jgi:hypothetical protein
MWQGLGFRDGADGLFVSIGSGLEVPCCRLGSLLAQKHSLALRQALALQKSIQV